MLPIVASVTSETSQQLHISWCECVIFVLFIRLLLHSRASYTSRIKSSHNITRNRSCVSFILTVLELGIVIVRKFDAKFFVNIC